MVIKMVNEKVSGEVSYCRACGASIEPTDIDSVCDMCWGEVGK